MLFQNTKSIFLLILVVVTQAGCSKDTEPEVVRPGTIEISVVNTAGSTRPGFQVYLFHHPVTTPEGSDPSEALATEETGDNGKAEFNSSDFAAFELGGTVYFSVLQETFSGDYIILGSTEVTLSEGVESLQGELVITEEIAGYEHGFMPTTISQELVVKEYNRWKETQVVACNDGLRVVSENRAETKVEAIGFGMLLSAYAKDKVTFDGLHKFYNSKRTAQAANMMAWDVTCSGITDPGSATDGDIDVAFSLIVADKQWGGTYLDDAKAILQTVRDHVIVECAVSGDEVLVLGPGYSNIAWGGCQMMDIMYHTPAFFRIFAEVTGDNTWAQLAEDTYITLDAGAHPVTGLVPDWQTANGDPGPGGRAGHFGYDACRAPWKLTLDFLWNGNAQSEAWAKKISTWASGVGPANIVDGYELNGTPRGTNGLNSAFLGGFSVATMAHSQTTTDQFGTELSKLNDTYWFNLNTRCLYLFTLSGNFWDPTKK